MTMQHRRWVEMVRDILQDEEQVELNEVKTRNLAIFARPYYCYYDYPPYFYLDDYPKNIWITPYPARNTAELLDRYIAALGKADIGAEIVVLPEFTFIRVTKPYID